MPPFGSKKAAIYCDGQKQDEEAYEVFFHRDVANHPGNASNTNWPNWMVYWLQTITSADPTLIVLFGSESRFWPGETKIRIGADCASSGDRLYAKNPLQGIHLFTWAFVHEVWHVAKWPLWWGSQSYGEWYTNHVGKVGPDDDKDGEYIPNKVEDHMPYNGQWDQPAERYDWDALSTPISGRPAGYESIVDSEDMNCWENRAVQGSEDGDWGDPGMNHSTKGVYDD